MSESETDRLREALTAIRAEFTVAHVGWDWVAKLYVIADEALRREEGAPKGADSPTS